MPLRDILLQMNTHPEPTPGWALDNTAAIARTFGAILSVGVCQVRIPPVSNWLANRLVNANDLIAAENQKSAAHAKTLVTSFEASVEEAARGEALVVQCSSMVTHWELARHARAYDLLVVPVDGHEQSVPVAEGLIFDMGRPVLLLTEDAAGGTFDHVVVGWDGSRAAARALADALSICARAKNVTIASVVGDKDLQPGTPVADVLRHLARHDITAEAASIPADGRNAGEALQAFCSEAAGDLLVMGAYGQSRIREFVLGGATRSVIANPTLPVFLSH